MSANRSNEARAPILDYSAVLKIVSKPKLLVGNGFSIACCPTIFTYNALLEEADFSAVGPFARTIFDRLETKDFEKVIRALNETAIIARHYGCSDNSLLNAIQMDADGIKEQLAKTIARRHPDHPSAISFNQYKSCRSFLSSFDKVFSLNYDLLLYWTSMQDDPSLAPFRADDGFRRGDLGKCGYVKWDLHEANTQSIYYLHGALHLFDQGSEFIKFTWVNTEVRLIDQVREALAQNKFPKIVSEGSSSEKADRIAHCAYLHKGLRSLINCGGDLIVYGMAFSENDEHIVDCIIRGNIKRVFVSLYGDPKSAFNQDVMGRVLTLPTRRTLQNARQPLSVSFFNAESANVWNKYS